MDFNSPKELVNFLMDNPGRILKDSYGRKWMYSNFNFHFKDIGENDIFEIGIKSLHLYSTVFIPSIPLILK